MRSLEHELRARIEPICRDEWMSLMDEICNMLGIRLFMSSILGTWALLEEGKFKATPHKAKSKSALMESLLPPLSYGVDSSLGHTSEKFRVPRLKEASQHFSIGDLVRVNGKSGRIMEYDPSVALFMVELSSGDRRWFAADLISQATLIEPEVDSGRVKAEARDREAQELIENKPVLTNSTTKSTSCAPLPKIAPSVMDNSVFVNEANSPSCMVLQEVPCDNAVAAHSMEKTSPTTLQILENGWVAAPKHVLPSSRPASASSVLATHERSCQKNAVTHPCGQPLTRSLAPAILCAADAVLCKAPIAQNPCERRQAAESPFDPRSGTLAAPFSLELINASLNHDACPADTSPLGGPVVSPCPFANQGGAQSNTSAQIKCRSQRFVCNTMDDDLADVSPSGDSALALGHLSHEGQFQSGKAAQSDADTGRSAVYHYASDTNLNDHGVLASEQVIMPQGQHWLEHGSTAATENECTKDDSVVLDTSVDPVEILAQHVSEPHLAQDVLSDSGVLSVDGAAPKHLVVKRKDTHSKRKQTSNVKKQPIVVEAPERESKKNTCVCVVRFHPLLKEHVKFDVAFLNLPCCLFQGDHLACHHFQRCQSLYQTQYE
jgi:hypothetical protein